ncbi:carbonyl reductase [Moniliophthora roreri MCA 2997]|uniref:Carbonyl reductase n=2 Tax=Moniliophthora roreri TaxID=221103 RepID=V2XUV2_MONRO|nr:carbonyl reductase [Moniliophthora roreri MCA 2997]KAI3618662.1 carbonyl reductase [Moniliophthora roreri]
MTSPLVIIVTGANKGIGFETIRNLAKNASSSFLAKEVKADGALIYLTARDEARGKEALQKLRLSGSTRIEFVQLDVSDPQSVEQFKNFIASRHERVHALINNAGVAPAVAGDGGRFDSKTINWVMSVNYWGVRSMTKAFLPLMHEKGRIVNLSSGLSHLGPISNRTLVQRFLTASRVEQADALAKEWQDSVADGSYSKKGWPSMSYSVSKMLMNALTRAFAAENAKAHPNLLINWIEPGWVTTDMGGPWASDGDAKEGSRCPTFAAIGDLKGKSGVGFDKDTNEREWYSRK